MKYAILYFFNKMAVLMGTNYVVEKKGH